MKHIEYRKMFEFENEYWWYRGLHELICSFIATEKTSRIKKNKQVLHVLDAGCGTGRMMELLQTEILKSKDTIEGFDYSHDAVAFCRERGLKGVRQEDLNHWSPKQNKYDVIISSDVISNAGVQDDMEVLEMFYKALKADGMLILNLPAFELLFRRHDAAISGARRYRKKYILPKLRNMGFTVERASYRLPLLFYFLMLRKFLFERYSSKERNPGAVDSDLQPLPPLVNNLMLGMNRLENLLIRWKFPVFPGSSLFLVLRKKD